MKLKHPNRINKRKHKKGCGCKMCKPWKGKYEHQFSAKDRANMKKDFDGL